MKPGLIKDFRAWTKITAQDSPRLLIIDPGGTTGFCLVHEGNYGVGSIPLEKLPCKLSQYVPTVQAVVCEDFSIQPGRFGDPKAPSAIGIGMCWSECVKYNVPLFLFQPNMKTAGRRSLDQLGLDTRAAARNDHQRDVIDLAGKVMSELRKANQ